MACIVGMTTNPDRRKKERKEEYPNLYDWRIMGTYGTKSEAQREENRIARRHGCDSGRGGAGPERATWHVYKFKY